MLCGHFRAITGPCGRLDESPTLPGVVVTFEVVLLIAGLLFLGAAVSGGGLTAKEIAIPELRRSARAACGLIGLVAVGGAALLIWDARSVPPVPSAGSIDTGVIAATPDPTGEASAGGEAADPVEHGADASPSSDDGAASGSGNSDQQKLLAALPGQLRDYCSRSEFGLGELGARASLECQLPTGLLVDYHWFATPERMNAVIDTDAENAGVSSGAGCQDASWPGYGVWDAGSTPSVDGRVLCFHGGQEARIVWTYESSNLFAHAVRSDGDHRTLRDWWMQHRELASELG
jgi:hypothetical protein